MFPLAPMIRSATPLTLTPLFVHPKVTAGFPSHLAMHASVNPNVPPASSVLTPAVWDAKCAPQFVQETATVLLVAVDSVISHTQA